MMSSLKSLSYIAPGMGKAEDMRGAWPARLETPAHPSRVQWFLDKEDNLEADEVF